MSYLQTIECPRGCKSYFYKIDLNCLYFTETGKLLVYDAFTPTNNSPDMLNAIREVIDKDWKSYYCSSCRSEAIVKYFVGKE